MPKYTKEKVIERLEQTKHAAAATAPTAAAPEQSHTINNKKASRTNKKYNLRFNPFSTAFNENRCGSICKMNCVRVCLNVICMANAVKMVLF